MRLRLPQRREQVPDFEQLTPFERAAVRFNASEAGRTAAGLMRTLGEPRVSVGASAGEAEEVRVTVAWELAWYQWGVDVSAGGGEVHEIAKGVEISELDSAARQWNAAAREGRIVLG